MSAELPTAGDTNTDASHSSSLSDGNLSESASVESTEPIDESLNSSDLKFDPDDQNVYYPVFALTEVPQEYLDTMFKYICRIYYDYDSTKAMLGTEHPTVDQVYETFQEMRPSDDSRPHQNISHFTFIVIDAQCLASTPWTHLVCCDAPDFDDPDDRPLLKQIRLPHDYSAEKLDSLEMLIMTPSEVEYGLDHPDSFVHCVSPAPYFADTLGGARAIKDRGIRGLKRMDLMEAERQSRLDSVQNGGL